MYVHIHKIMIIAAIGIIILAMMFYIPKNLFQQPTVENQHQNKFYSKPISADNVPVIEIVNRSFSNTYVNITKNWRVRFVNKDNTSYTLIIPDIGIEEKLPPSGVTELTFYKEGNITFWTKELGINVTNGTVHVE